jgi:hypothetical protein
MSASTTTKEALWLRSLLFELRSLAPGPTQMNCDNQAAITLLTSPISSQRSKHIDVHYHFARQHVVRQAVAFTYCNTNDNTSDCMTKALPKDKFTACRSGMGITGVSA